ALSHCWGTTSQFTTTKVTIYERKENIFLAQLTNTFREAVQVARALKIRYLWIDSLCIVQDDHDDWAQEASRMLTVYRNALITISATSSKSGNEGLFQRWSEFETRVIPGDEEAGTFIFSAEREHFGGQWGSHRQEYPLLSRAWALQERLLSPRILHFGRSELHFECIEEFRCECSGTQDYSWTTFIKEPKIYLLSRILLRQAAGEIWQSILRQHSSLQLTYPSDKLVALGGLAKQLAEPGDQYLAGLWKSRILENLQWEIARHVDLHPRPKWRVPSWSWASIEGSLSAVSAFARSSTPMRHELSAQLIDYKIVPKTNDEYGEIQSGTIQLLAHCSLVTWKENPEKCRCGNTHYYVVFPNDQERDVITDAIDEITPMHTTQAGPVETVCVLIYEHQSQRTSLVLRRLKSERYAFQRVGLTRDVGINGPLEDVWRLFPRERRIVTIV
ncbi:heterokaryon incompatibility protein-domain-containing protein, partial [Alternaria rosae]|uniref:heterokaryon incompatibility protein-domain-containing protein n=1 Tax=Alternaria rosae TaxID=1187941 RepID=UPI001E8DCCAB